MLALIFSMSTAVPSIPCGNIAILLTPSDFWFFINSFYFLEWFLWLWIVVSIIALNWCCLLWNLKYPCCTSAGGSRYCSRDTAQVATLIGDPGLHTLFEGSVFYERIIFWQVWWIWIFLNARVGQGPLYPYRRIAAVVVVPRPWFIPAIAESLQTYFLQDTAAHKFCEGEMGNGKLKRNNNWKCMNEPDISMCHMPELTCWPGKKIWLDYDYPKMINKPTSTRKTSLWELR